MLAALTGPSVHPPDQSRITEVKYDRTGFSNRRNMPPFTTTPRFGNYVWLGRPSLNIMMLVIGRELPLASVTPAP